MDQERFGNVVAHALTTREPVDPLAVGACLDTTDLAAIAEAHGFQLTAVAGEAGAKAVGSEVQLDQTEVVTVPEIDKATAAKLETLSPEFREVVTTRYAEKYRAVDGYIAEDKLPEAYRLPPLGELIDRVVAVAPAYEAISRVTGGQVEFDFALQGLTDEQKSALATGHILPNGRTTTGAYNYNADREVTDPTNPPADESRWDTAVMDVSEMPEIRGISADGSKTIEGVQREPILLALADMRDGGIGLPKLPGSKKGLSAEELLVCQLSPSEDTKFAIQLGRLERGEQPVDANGIWTIGKENVKVDEALWSVFSNFDADSRRLNSDYGDRDDADGDNVVRLSARGKDFKPRS